MRRFIASKSKLKIWAAVFCMLFILSSICVYAKEVKGKGVMVKTPDGTMFVFDTGETAKSVWVNYKKKKYYFNEKGVLVKNAWVGSRYVGSDGAKVDIPSKKAILKSGTAAMNKKKKRLIIAGASRVKHMMMHTASQYPYTLYVCKSGAAYSWFNKTALDQIRAYLELYPNSTVVFQFGNNDLNKKKPENLYKYVEQYRKLMEEYPNADFYVMDALPGRHEKKNRKRVQYNNALKKLMKGHYIGGYDYMMKEGFCVVSDGEHYTKETSTMIYEYIVRKTGWTLG